MTLPVSSVILLKLQWIRYKNNMVNWCSDAVIFLGGFKWLCIVITQQQQNSNMIAYFRSLKLLGIVITQQNMGNWCSGTVIVYSGVFKRLSFAITQQILVPWCSDTVIGFLGDSNNWASSLTEIFVINMSFVHGLDTGLFLIMTLGLSSRAKVVL